MQCKICSNSGNNKKYSFKELMYGTKKEFDYFECSECGCLQIMEIPNNLSEFYPANYYSFESNKKSESFLKNYMKRKRFWYSVNNKGFIGKLLVSKFGAPQISDWVKKADIKSSDSILDVGCGDGHIIKDFYNAGYKNVTGIDAFIEKDILLGSKVKVLKRRIEDITEKYDFIMFNHSFEHVVDPVTTFTAIKKALNPGGTAMIRIPVTGKFAWREFGESWVSLDAPRHLFLHSEKSMMTLAGKTGLKPAGIVYDSNSFQFWGSIQYQKNITLRGPKSYADNPEGSIFSNEEIRGFEERALLLNKENDGDQACFYFKNI